MHSETVKFKS